MACVDVDLCDKIDVLINQSNTISSFQENQLQVLTGVNNNTDLTQKYVEFTNGYIFFGLVLGIAVVCILWVWRIIKDFALKW